ncbi:MAG TPA: hypothetical protein VFC63_06580 [Blastocatellia bacterium]|nr:hypothetical protein [Blastocatellia bacterium]
MSAPNKQEIIETVAIESEFSDPVVVKLVEFVRSIGIPVHAASIPDSPFFPGLKTEYGAVLVDETELLHPGNILHEAGHLAVTDPALRNEKDIFPTNGQEIAALAWSYAATRYLGLPSDLVFYQGSYRGWDTALVENFAEGRYLGVPLLQLYKMSFEPGPAAARGVEPFPRMQRWLR